MAQEEQILIEVKFDSSMVDKAAKDMVYATEEIKRLKDEQKSLNEQWKEGTLTNEQYGKALAENKKELEANQRALKSNTAVVQAATLAQYDNTKSLDEQRQYLNTLQKAYASMDKEQMDMMGGQEELAKQINAVSKAVKEQEHAIGDDRRNVGNYTESIVEAANKTHNLADAFKVSSVASTGLGKATDSLDKAMKLAAKNPWMAVLSLLLPLLKSLWNALKGNEQAMAEVKKILDAMRQSFKQFEPLVRKVAGVLTNVLGKAFDVITTGITKFLKGIDWLAAKLGFDLNLSGVFEEAANASNEMADDIEEDNDRIENSSKKTTNTLIEQENKLDALREKMRLRRMEGWQRELEELKRIREEELKVEGLTVQEMLEISEFYAEESQNIIDKQIKLLQDTSAKIGFGDEEEEDEDIPSVEDMARKHFGLDEEGVQYFMSLLAQGVDAQTAATQAIDDQWNRNAKGVLKVLHNVGDGFQAMGDILGNFAEESEEAAKAQKAFTMIGILTNQAASISEGALAIAKGVESASALPFPLNIPAVISVTATISGLLAGVASSIAQAKQLFSQAESAGNYADGGIVPGTSYTGDRLRANVNSREMILPLAEQKVLFDALSSAADGNRTLGINYEMMAAAMASVPAPNLVLTELAQEQQKIVTFDEITSV